MTGMQPRLGAQKMFQDVVQECDEMEMDGCQVNGQLEKQFEASETPSRHSSNSFSMNTNIYMR